MSRATFLPSRKTLVLLALAAVVIGGAAWWNRGPVDPVYQGKRLSEMLYEDHKIGMSTGGGQGGVMQVAGRGLVTLNPVPGSVTPDTIKAMGPDAVIWLGYAVAHGRLSPANLASPVFPGIAPAKKISSPSGIEHIRALLRKWLHLREDDSYDESATAAWMLIQLGPAAAPAIPNLARALGDVNSQRSDNAWKVLNSMGPPASPAVREALQRGTLATRLKIVRELPYARWFTGRKLAEEEYAKNLQAALAVCGDGDAEIREWAAITVAECSFARGYSPAMEPAMRILIARLSDPDAKACIRAASYVALFGPHARDALPRLIELIGDTTPAVRGEAVKAISRIDENGQVPRFRQLLDDPDPTIRDSAKSYLTRLGEPLGE